MAQCEGTPLMGFLPCEAATPVPEQRAVVEWEETACLLCGRHQSELLLEAPDTVPDGSGLWFAVVQCQDCGLCFTNPRPSRKMIAQFYPATYRPHQKPDARKCRPRFVAAGSWPRPRNERHALPWHGEGRLLDFGCGSGSYLARMAGQGWRVTGLDASLSAVQRIRQELGLDALVGSLPHPQLRPESFDIVTMWHSLEHVHDPLEVLRQARGLLVAGGKLLVAVPNIDSLPFRWFGHAWYGLDLPRHLTHFSAWTLKLMLQRAGFRVGAVRMLRHSEWVRSSARLSARYRRAQHWHRWLQTKPASRMATWYSYLTQQSDCMMVIAEK
jgi:2-polyprenyl-3-methyl-5-hydroxy-6-metoxy-1,4-benzoquinol methylase